MKIAILDMDNLIVLPTKTMQKKLLGIDYVSSINAKMKDITKADITKRDLFEVLQENILHQSKEV
jgi:ABC-type lipoprotein release transport system permease subunit